MSPKPITDYLTDFDRPAASAAPPVHPVPANDAIDPEAVRAEAFAAGKREGLELAEARHALERRRIENETLRTAGERASETETRMGAEFAARLENELARLGETLSREAAACIAPFVRTAAEQRMLDAMAEDARRLPGAAHITVSGPRPLVEAMLRRLEPSVRERVRMGGDERLDLRIETDDLALATRLGELDDALRTA